MNQTKVVGLFLGLAMLSLGCQGGNRYRDLVDPCYPERYNAAARAEVVSYFAPQVQNGHVLDQTIWNYHFERGTANLHPAGRDKLDQLVRTRPVPDPQIFLATARDITAEPAKFAEERRQLDEARKQAIEEYVMAQTAGRPMHFDVLVHDPSEPFISAEEGALAISRNRIAVQGAGIGGGGFGGAGGGFGGGVGGPGGNVGAGGVGAGAGGAVAGGGVGG